MSVPSSPGASPTNHRGWNTPASASSSCLRSFVIYNPNLSQGKEERAMDNILFFYPPTVHPNKQMNHVGMCIAVMCFTERFQNNLQPKIDLDEIRTDRGCITLYSPMPDYYMALESDELYDSSICTPLLRKAFSTFVIRHGIQAFNDPNSSSEESSAMIQHFFTRFCYFLDRMVMNMSPDGKQLPPPPSHDHLVFPTSPIPSPSNGSLQLRNSIQSNVGDTTGQLPSPRMPETWRLEALSESLLHSPLRMHSTTTYQYQTCGSIVSQYLSLLTAQCPLSSAEFMARWRPDATTSSSSVVLGQAMLSPKQIPQPGPNHEESDSPRQPSPFASATKRQNSSFVVGNVHETLSNSSPRGAAAALLAGGPHDACCPLQRCMWSGIQYLLLRRSDRRVLVSSCGDAMSLQLAYLSMIEPDVTSFLLHGNGSLKQHSTTTRSSQPSPRFCCVQSMGDVMVFLVVEDAIQASLYATVDRVATQLAEELSVWMRTGTCSLMRQSAPTAASLLAWSATANHGKQSSMAGGPTASPVQRHQLKYQLQQQEAAAAAAKTANSPSSSASQAITTALRDGTGWVCWNHHLVHGALLANYPRLVQWTLGGLMREAIVAIRRERQSERTDSQLRQELLRNGSINGCSSIPSFDPKYGTGSRVAERGFVECWLPLGAEGWVFVCQRQGRVIGVPYYGGSNGSAAYLLECFDMADKTVSRLFNGITYLAPSS